MAQLVAGEVGEVGALAVREQVWLEAGQVDRLGALFVGGRGGGLIWFAGTRDQRWVIAIWNTNSVTEYIANYLFVVAVEVIGFEKAKFQLLIIDY